MKKHNFNEAISIFKGMFEGWSMVTEEGKNYSIIGVDYKNRPIGFFAGLAGDEQFYDELQISHLEQTLPMNGDEVWAWDKDGKEKYKRIYIGKSTDGWHICSSEENSVLSIWKNVELNSPTRKLTITEAIEILKGLVQEPFEIVENKSE